MAINKTKGVAGSRNTPPQRRCVGCRQMLDKKELLRVVKSPNGEFVIDETGKAAGRGAYICKGEGCVKALVKGRGLDRSFKGKVPVEIYEEIAAKPLVPRNNGE